MNGQIVLCRGVNDGAELDRSIRDLTKHIPAMQSVSVVPVGLSKYRDGLYPLEPFTPEQLGDTIDLIEKWQKKIYAEHGIHFIHASDEFYMGAGRPLPEADRYEWYIQLENGVGMIRLMEEEIARRWSSCIRERLARCARRRFRLQRDGWLPRILSSM